MLISNHIVGKAIAHLRQQSGMTQQQLASALNVSHQAVSKWENGLALPDIGSMLQLTRIFGVTLEQLLYGKLEGFCAQTENTETVESFDTFCSLAGKAVKAAEDFGTSIVEGVSKAFAGAEELFTDLCSENNDGCVENVNKVSDGSLNDTNYSSENHYMSLSSLISLAPFMSRAKLSEEIEKSEEIPTFASVISLAPYISGETIDLLLGRCPEDPDSDVLIKLAPFMKKERLFAFIMQHPELLTLDNIRRFAPFLKRSMVDSLVELINKARSTAGNYDIIKKADEFAHSLKDKMATPESASVTKDNENEPINNNPEQVQPSISSDLKNRVARAALEAKSWSWLEAHIAEISDVDVLISVVLDSDARSIPGLAEKALRLIDSEKRELLFNQLITVRDFETLIAFRPYADKNTSELILTAACEDTSQDFALEAVKAYCQSASKDLIDNLVQKALTEGNWLLVEALTPAM